ncbi:hypothetical protein DCAR_0933673 [Daucus carota subsp. sativus]|uniref:Uncharacterized protein n=1 Tax=Daucus carota subsp. sativus TaxID=79200 RepID=A0A175YDT0_DAUCS|nr:PREDICTED: RNA demethylase ALKBH5-like [Daucus carota subsp. sativus]WOH14157.1 hypothetical protein DCAR_0933673 [Daucus carota subsp. sativus]
MVGKPAGESPESGTGDGWLNLINGLEREEMVEILSRGVCDQCQSNIQARVLDLLNKKYQNISISEIASESSPEFKSADSSNLDSQQKSLESSIKTPSWGSLQTPESVYVGLRKASPLTSSPATVNNKQSSTSIGPDSSLSSALPQTPQSADKEISDEQIERIGFAQVGRNKKFVHIEKINGKATNVLQGLELHTKVFSADEQKKIVECVYDFQRRGQNGQLRERTYSEPTKWMRGKGRITIQFGCCYNYAVDKNGNPPGIIRDEEVDPLPPLFKQMIKRMVRWHVLPPSCVPNSCIVNIYEAGDCIPPHIDHHDFLRPFCTVSFLTESNILFGSNLKISGPGEFEGPVSIPLPMGSVLILNGNGADIAKHCVPAVSAKRISITFRKMDDSKLPFKFTPDPELQGLRPLGSKPLNYSPVQNKLKTETITPSVPITAGSTPFSIGKDDFPPLGGSKSVKRRPGSRRSS